MRKILFLILLAFCGNACFGQKPKYVFQFHEEERLDEKKLQKWMAKTPNSYSGIYHFGDSEAEWDLVVIISDSALILQSYSNYWGKLDNSKDETWLKECKTFKNAKLMSNKFTSNEITGYFMSYKGGGNIRGIILTAPTGTTDTVEFGAKEKISVSDYFVGDFPQLSAQVVEDSFFTGRTNDELRIMRNEIFARYGKRFDKNGRIYNHFIKKEWYRPWRDNVENCLTEIEQTNLRKILSFEANNGM